MAWVADDTGALEIYLAPRDSPGSKLRVSTSGGSWPTFSHDGRELFYLSQDGRLMTIAIRTTPTVTAGKPAALFRTGGRDGATSTLLPTVDSWLSSSRSWQTSSRSISCSTGRRPAECHPLPGLRNESRPDRQDPAQGGGAARSLAQADVPQ